MMIFVGYDFRQNLTIIESHEMKQIHDDWTNSNLKNLFLIQKQQKFFLLLVYYWFFFCISTLFSKKSK
jgi:hypothetical protein